jgi:PPK2 family polyphosphate:nucleotide phosphotransferase
MGRAGSFAEPFRVTNGGKFRLKDFDPAATGGLKSKAEAEEWLQKGVALLSEFQEKLYADDHRALLLIFQGMDGAGKDGAIKHVMSGVNPQGVQVYSFKAPSAEELDHDFLWRTTRCLPERGRIGIFNRSYYEETLVVRVHPELLAKQRIPPALVTKSIWKERFEDINALERYLTRNGIAVLKFFLHISKEEQRKRFLKRLDDREKHWKFSPGDVHERQFWNAYMEAYEDMIRHTATPDAPWYVIPADNKWFARMTVAAAIVDTLEDLKLSFPQVTAAERKALAAQRALLEGKSK